MSGCGGKKHTSKPTLDKYNIGATYCLLMKPARQLLGFKNRLKSKQQFKGMAGLPFENP